MKVTDLHLDEETIKFSETLNTDIWNNDELKPQVYKKLMEIADAFIEYLDLDLNIVDIQFTGSMANYNFNEDSDIDLHIIADFEEFGINYDIISNYFNAKKSLFNQNHNITIYGHPVELYVEDKNQPSQSKGKYSLKFDKWLIKPQKITQEVEDVIDSPKYLEYIERFNAIVSSDYNAQEANDLLDELYNIRKEGLNKEGELSEDNLIFKSLRSNGILKYLRQYINDNYDKSLSLTESAIKLNGLNRIAGIYNINDRTHKELPKGKWHNLTDKDYENGLVRYGIQDMFNERTCYITAADKGYAIKTYKFIKSKYDHLLIDQYELEFLTDNGSMFIKLDSDGHQIFENKDVQHYDSQSIKKIIEEDFKKDKDYREIAKKLIKATKKAINNKDTQLLNSSSDIYLNMTDEFNKIDDIFKNSGKEFYIRFCQGSESFSHMSADNDLRKMVSFPILPVKPLRDFMIDLLMKNSKEYFSIKEKYENTDDYSLEVQRLFLKLALKYIKKHSKHYFEYDESLFHEFIHMIDFLRHTPTFKSKEQKFNTKKDYEDYHNSPTEQNAYYQETVHLFDDWIIELNRNNENTFTFDENDFTDFYNEFKRQYRGNYDYLNIKNKNRLRKRAYQYWKNTFKNKD